MSRIAILGTGAWGTALALSVQSHEVHLIARDEASAQCLRDDRENKKNLPGYALTDIHITSSYTILGEVDFILWALPTQTLPDVWPQVAAFIPPQTPIILCCKGILQNQEGTIQRLPAHFMKLHALQPIGILSGPNFAHEVAQGLPFASTLAFDEKDDLAFVAAALRSKSFRVYQSHDLIGTQICGALKNVMAIACGILHAKALGENAKAALITRGLAEIMRLGLQMGAQTETFMGLAGMGDLLLTCSSLKSRNTKFGHALVTCGDISQALALAGGVVEGYYTVRVAHELAQTLNVRMPITTALFQILYGHANLDKTIDALMNTQSEFE